MSQIDTEGRVEPTFGGDIALENISFLKKARPTHAPARVRALVWLLVLGFLAFNLWKAMNLGMGGPGLTGAVLGTLFAIGFPVWISGLWDQTQRTRYKVALWTLGVLVASTRRNPESSRCV